jgi:hypothetical protein
VGEGRQPATDGSRQGGVHPPRPGLRACGITKAPLLLRVRLWALWVRIAWGVRGE